MSKASRNDSPKDGVLFDPVAFARDIRAARDETAPSQEEEARHWNKIRLWTAGFGVVGMLLGMRGVVSPLAMVLIALHRYGNFTMLAHHSLHGAWGARVRGSFAKGLYRRVVDWLDWIFPDAWNVEHNKEHHYHLNEDADPDYVQRNSTGIRDVIESVPARYMAVIVNAMMWKWYYYASNTLKLLHAGRPDTPPKDVFDGPLTLEWAFLNCLSGKHKKWHTFVFLDLVFRVLGPPLLLNFIFFPAVAGYISSHFLGESGWYAFAITLLNSAGAELLNNVHAFNTIVTNHAGADLWHFQDSCLTDTGEFYLRAVLGSAAYQAGNDYIDYFHGYLNYQAEHHAFPALTPLHYQRLHPGFKAVCATYGVPYIQEPFWIRTMKTMSVMVGTSTHLELKGQASEQPEMWMNNKFKIRGG